MLLYLTAYCKLRLETGMHRVILCSDSRIRHTFGDI